METKPTYYAKLQNLEPNSTYWKAGKKNQNTNEGTMSKAPSTMDFYANRNKLIREGKIPPKSWREVQEATKGNSKIFVKSNKDKQIKNSKLITSVKK